MFLQAVFIVFAQESELIRILPNVVYRLSAVACL